MDLPLNIFSLKLMLFSTRSSLICQLSTFYGMSLVKERKPCFSSGGISGSHCHNWGLPGGKDTMEAYFHKKLGQLHREH